MSNQVDDILEAVRIARQSADDFRGDEGVSLGPLNNTFDIDVRGLNPSHETELADVIESMESGVGNAVRNTGNGIRDFVGRIGEGISAFRGSPEERREGRDNLRRALGGIERTQEVAEGRYPEFEERFGRTPETIGEVQQALSWQNQAYETDEAVREDRGTQENAFAIFNDPDVVSGAEESNRIQANMRQREALIGAQTGASRVGETSFDRSAEAMENTNREDAILDLSIEQTPENITNKDFSDFVLENFTLTQEEQQSIDDNGLQVGTIGNYINADDALSVIRSRLENGTFFVETPGGDPEERRLRPEEVDAYLNELAATVGDDNKATPEIHNALRSVFFSDRALMEESAANAELNYGRYLPDIGQRIRDFWLQQAATRSIPTLTVSEVQNQDGFSGNNVPVEGPGSVSYRIGRDLNEFTNNLSQNRPSRRELPFGQKSGRDWEILQAIELLKEANPDFDGEIMGHPIDDFQALIEAPGVYSMWESPLAEIRDLILESQQNR